MAVALPRERWTDERLDDLNKKVDKGFEDVRAEMRGGFDRVDADIRELRSDMNARFEKVDARFEKVDDRFDAVHRTLHTWGVAIIAALIGLHFF